MSLNSKSYCYTYYGVLTLLVVLGLYYVRGVHAFLIEPTPLPTLLRLHSLRCPTHSYCSYWERLLLTEHQQTVADLRDRRRNWSPQRLEDAGMSILDAYAEPDSELLGEKLVRVYKPGKQQIYYWNDRFSKGDILLMTTSDNRSRDCLVVDVGQQWMTLGVGASWPAGLWEARRHPGEYTVRLDRTAPQAPLKAQREALELVRKGMAGPVAELLTQLHVRHQQDNLHHQQQQQQDDSCVQKAAEPPTRLAGMNTTQRVETIVSALEQAKRDTAFEPNESQQQAIVWSLQQTLSLLLGPPGTGKTRVAALLVSTAMRLNNQTRVLAVAHSNGAADVLLQALLQMGVPAVRLGRPASVASDLQHRTVLAMTEKHPEVVRLRQRARDVRLSTHERTAAEYEIRQSVSNVQQSITETAPVVVASCIGAHQLNNVEFPLVVLDEAAQTTEPAFVCALAAAKAQQVVLVGDTRQLPPTIACMELRKTLGVSPMARLEEMGVAQQTLRVQYRMVPALLKHPSSYFYKGLVKCADDNIFPVDSSLPPPAGFSWPTRHPLAFVNVNGLENEISHGFGGKSNPEEARTVARIVSNLLAAGDVDSSNIAVISPYSKQVQRIRSELALRHGGVRVGSVDSFQGQETDVVVISCVRSNENGELGFLRDSRRLCVAITRARRALVIVGDKRALLQCRHWAALLNYYERLGAIMKNTKHSEIAKSVKEDKDMAISVGKVEVKDAIRELFGEDHDDEFSSLFR